MGLSPALEIVSVARLRGQNFANGSFIADDAGIEERHLIGTDNIMFEGDYPHSDSNFPASRAKLTGVLSGVPDAEARKIAEDNARRVFNFPRPAGRST